MNEEISLKTQIAEIEQAIKEIKETDDKIGLFDAEEDLRAAQNSLNQIQLTNSC